MSLKFGTSGLRGLVEDLLSGAAARYSGAFGRHMVGSCRLDADIPVYVGQDLRESSPAIAADVMRGLFGCGLTPVDCGHVPTPALALYAMARGSPSIMVTGSHIPANRNGLKFYRPDGEIGKDDETAIASIADAVGMENGTRAAFAGPADAGNRARTVSEAYCSRFARFMPAEALAGMRIGIYEHSSVSRDILADIVARFGAQTVSLARSVDFIPVDTEAVDPRTAVSLKDWAGEFGLDAIISTDGDGDRPLLADENGDPVRGDAMGLVASLHLKADCLVTPVTSNSGIEARCAASVMRTRVGSPYVIAGMESCVQERPGASVIGFEANGGLLTATSLDVSGFLLPPLPTRDAILPMLCTLATAAGRKASISRLVGELDLPVAASGRVENFVAERSASLMSWLRGNDANISRFVAGLGTVRGVEDIDGLKVFLDDGMMIHFRPSGNAPEMRCYTEAPGRGQADYLLKEGLRRIENYQAGH